jgi:tetratricopeptide (TPR) repeat protein
MNELEISSDGAVLAALAARIGAGDVTAEGEWTAVFERLANGYFADDPQALLALVAGVVGLPLQTAVARQTRLYFQGVAHFKGDEYEAALVCFDALLAEEGLPLTLHARALNSRSVVCRLNGRLQEAMDGYRASLALWQQLGNGHYQGIVHLNLGIILYGLRDYAAAEGHLRQAEELFAAAESWAWWVSVQNELGLVQRDQGNWAAALAYFDQVIARRRADGAVEDVGMGLANRGEILLFMGELVAAKETLTEALGLMVSQTYRVDQLLFLGLAEQAEGALAAAERHYEEALALATELDRQEALPHVLTHLADLRRQLGDDAGALAAWVRAVELIEAGRRPLQEEGLQISLLGRWQQVFEALVLHCLAMGRVAEAFAWAERARARAFAEVVVDGEGLPSLTAVQEAIAADTAVLVYFTTGVLEQDMPLLRAIAVDNPLRPLVLLPGKTILFVLTRQGIVAHDCGLNPNALATRSLRGDDGQRFWQTAVLTRLRQDLLAGAEAVAQMAHWVIVPHGPLHRVPFAALCQDGPPISLTPSVVVWLHKVQERMLPAVAGLRDGLAVGYGGMVNGRELPYAEREAQQVARMLGGAVWVDDAPKKERLRDAAQTCRWLHLACHGWFDEADPLGSYLETGADERLTAREVLAQWQLTTELVALSACQTGVSQILRGDEPMGLVRAFLAAGARAVLVSQWVVDDLATCLLMLRFYELAQDGLAWDVALARAQAWLRAATAAELQAARLRWGLADLPVGYGEPKYWAGFVLVT